MYACVCLLVKAVIVVIKHHDLEAGADAGGMEDAWRDAADWLAPHHLLSLLPYKIQDHHPQSAKLSRNPYLL